MTRPSWPRRTRALLAAVLAALVTLAGLAGSGTEAMAQPARPSSKPAASATCPQQEPPTGLVAAAHPVVLVHGWTGSPMGKTRTKLETIMKPGWQFKLFDYSKVATHWAARAEVAECLARYLDLVSKAHKAARGDGRVFVVAHSMGGLATAFALDPDHGRIADLAGRIGGLVTIDTPWTGSAWGQSNYAALISWIKGAVAQPTTLFGDAGSDAWVCLRNQSARATRGSCETAPYLPKTVPVAQIGGDITLARHFLGFHGYDISLGGDTIVRMTSQHGYLGSAPGTTLGFHTTIRTISCTVRAESLKTLAGTTGGVFGTWLGIMSQLHSDGQAMDALAADKVNLPLVELTGAALVLSPCSHSNMPKNDDALAQVAGALRQQAKGPQLQPTDLLNAPIPADCMHKAGTLKNGDLPGLGPTQGFASVRMNGTWVGPSPVLTDMTGDGQRELVGVMYCSAGGVGWPHRLLVYEPGPRLLGSLGLGDVTPAEHGEFLSIKASGRDLAVTWKTYEGCCMLPRTFSGTVHWDGAKLAMKNLRQLSGVKGNPYDWKVTTTGIGQVTLGMTKAQAKTAGLVTGTGACAWSDGMAEVVRDVLHVGEAADGRVKRLFLDPYRPNKTPSGAGIGTSVSALKSMYGARLVDAGDATEVSGHLYGVKDSAGNFIAFLVVDGKVTGIQVSNVKYSPNRDIFYASEWDGCGPPS